jgi:hypothetical protein
VAATEEAIVRAQLEGAEEFEARGRRLAQGLESGFDKAGKRAASALGGISGALGSMVVEGLKASGVFGSFSMGDAVQQARQLDASTARLGQTAGIAGDKLKASFEGMEAKILTSAPAMSGVSTALVRATHDAGFATKEIGGLGAIALSVGQTLEEQLAFGKTLHDGLGVTSDVVSEFDRMRTMAEAVGTPITAFKDTLTGIAPLLAGIGTGSDAARAKVAALALVLGKGLKPEQQTQVASEVLSYIQGNVRKLEKRLGHRITNRQGIVDDPAKVLKELKERGDKMAAGRSEDDRWGLYLNTFQNPVVAAAIMNADSGEIDRISKLKGHGQTEKDASAVRASKEGKRTAEALAQEQAARHVGATVLGVGDGIHGWLSGMLGEKGAAWAELGAGTVGLGGLGATGQALLQGGGGSGILPGLMELAAGPLGLAAGVSATFAAPAMAVLSDVGQDRDEMGADWRKDHAGVMGLELAGRAERAGWITEDIYKATGGDKEVFTEMLKVLEQNQQKHSAEFAQQIAEALAEVLHRAPMQVRLPKDPNKGDL